MTGFNLSFVSACSVSLEKTAARAEDIIRGMGGNNGMNAHVRTEWGGVKGGKKPA